jgi:DNA primase
LDELPPQTRRLLELLDAVVTRVAVTDQVDRVMVRFTRRRLREELGWGDTQLKVHLARLVDLELVAAHRVEHGSFLYELAWDGAAGRDGGRFMVGVTEPSQPPLPLADAETHDYDSSRSGPEAARSGPGRGLVGAWSAGGRTTPDNQQPNTGNGSEPPETVDGRNSTDTGGDTARVIDEPVVLAAMGGV